MNVAAASDYEWYVTVNDGTNSVTSPVWRFSTASELPPVVSIATPTNTATAFLPGSVEIAAIASASGGLISKVELYADGALLNTITSPPYSFVWTNPPVGNHLLTAIAQDQLGRRVTSSPMGITVVSDAAPTISITSPAYGTAFTAPATIVLNATATDSDGTVALVEFFADDTLIGTASSSPYSLTWSNVGVGSYLLTARATDNLGAVTTSSPVDVTVDNGFQLAGYWKLDDAAGSLAADSSGSGNTGTLLGGTTWTSGQSGSGLSLDGIDGYVELGNHASLNPVGQITICAWIKPASFAGTGHIVGKDRCLNDQYFFRVQAGGKLRFGIDTDLVHGATALALNTWQWVAATYDGAQMKIYVNGVLDGASNKKARMRDNGSGARIGNRASTSVFA